MATSLDELLKQDEEIPDEQLRDDQAHRKDHGDAKVGHLSVSEFARRRKAYVKRNNERGKRLVEIDYEWNDYGRRRDHTRVDSGRERTDHA